MGNLYFIFASIFNLGKNNLGTCFKSSGFQFTYTHAIHNIVPVLMPESSDSDGPDGPGGPGGFVGFVGGGPAPHPFGHAHLVVRLKAYEKTKYFLNIKDTVID